MTEAHCLSLCPWDSELFKTQSKIGAAYREFWKLKSWLPTVHFHQEVVVHKDSFLSSDHRTWGWRVARYPSTPKDKRPSPGDGSFPQCHQIDAGQTQSFFCCCNRIQKITPSPQSFLFLALLCDLRVLSRKYQKENTHLKFETILSTGMISCTIPFHPTLNRIHAVLPTS